MKIAIAEMSRQTSLDTTQAAINDQANQLVNSELSPVLSELAGGMQAIHAHITQPRAGRRESRKGMDTKG